MWAVDYFTKPKWELSNLKDHISEGTKVMTTIGDYFTKMLDNSMSWKDVENINKEWGRQFAIKGVMSVEDAKKAVDVGASAIMVSNHGGRQLDGSRSPFDQLAEIVDAVGDKIDVICEGGIRRGTHVLKALSLVQKHVPEEECIYMLWLLEVKKELKKVYLIYVMKLREI